ncbi:MAG TPA: sensor histidine kinase [Thermomicrobiaceae bacterium]|nr:sensor histidine kinase [Thermomicrobiaceae bacterium]
MNNAECRADGSLTHTSTHSWVRYAWVWPVMFTMLLGVAGSIALFGSHHSPAQRWAIAGLVIALAAGYFFTLRGRYGSHQIRKLAIAGLFLEIGLTLVAIYVDPIFTLLGFILPGLIYQILSPRWSIVPTIVVISALFAIPSYKAGDPVWRDPEELLLIVVIVVFSLFLAFHIDSIIEQSRERQRLVEELTETRAALAEREREAGIMQERSRLAREIHDTLAQGFTSIVMHLEAADQFLDDEPHDSRVGHHLDQARLIARDSLGEARRLVRALRPVSLDEASLPEALARLAARSTRESGIDVRASTTGEPRRLHPDVEVGLLRVAQEALANARKHSGAGQIQIILSFLEGEVMLEVSDDGVGFDPANLRLATPSDFSGGFGLTAMRERVEQLGGAIMVEGTPGQGASIVAAIPTRCPEPLNAEPPERAEPAAQALASAGAKPVAETVAGRAG